MKKITAILLALIVLVPFTAFSADQPLSDDAKQLEALVNEAAGEIEKKGKDIFPELRRKDGDWWKGATYVFVDGLDGIVLVHPIDASIEGKNLLEDPPSKPVMTLLIEKAKKDGSGWVEYMWPKEGESTPSRKISYIKKVKMPDGKEVIVGAGMYAEK